MQDFIGSPVRHVLIYKEGARWVAPPARMQIQSRADGLKSQLLDVVVKKVLEEAGEDAVAYTGERIPERVQRLVDLGREDLVQVSSRSQVRPGHDRSDQPTSPTDPESTVTRCRQLSIEVLQRGQRERRRGRQRQ